MRVVDEVVEGEDERVVAAPGAHHLHRREHDIGTQGVEPLGDGQLGRGRRMVEDDVRGVGQQRELRLVVDDRDDLDLGPAGDLEECGEQARAVAGDPVVAFGAGEPGIDCLLYTSPSPRD